MVIKFSTVNCKYCDNKMIMLAICPACARKRPEEFDN